MLFIASYESSSIDKSRNDKSNYNYHEFKILITFIVMIVIVATLTQGSNILGDAIHVIFTFFLFISVRVIITVIVSVRFPKPAA